MGILWPESSQLLCWHCCHRFDSVPCFTAHPDPSLPTGFYLGGNFCSWNCVKTHYFETCKNYRKATATQTIALLAFLTYHRPKFCPFPVTKHPIGCPCLDVYQGIPLAPRKECLQQFGGSMSISEFRAGFMMIESITWVQRCFVDNDHHIQDFHAITSTPQLRSFTYSFKEPKHSIVIQSKNKQEQEVEDNIVPILHSKKLKHKSLF